MNRKRLLSGIVMAIVFPPYAFGANYSFVKIAETGPRFSFLSNPAVNNHNEVAFRAGLVAGGEAILIGGAGIARAKVKVKTSTSLSNPTINDRASIGYDDASGVWRVTGTKKVRVAGAAFAYPSLNNMEQIAFSKTDSLALRIRTGSTSITLYDASGEFSALTPPTLNDFGSIAFVAGLDSGGQKVLIGDGRLPLTIAQTGADFLDFGGMVPDVNNNGLVAFFALIAAGEQGVFLGDGSGTSMVADSSGPFAEFRFPNVNADGTVAFEAILDGKTGRGIYRGPDPFTDKVIAPGDALFGSTVVTVFLFGDQALNDSGRITFLAYLADGRNVIALAKPK